MDEKFPTDGGTVNALGQSGTRAGKTLEWFPTPKGVDRVHLSCDEFTSLCPVTGQPDWATVDIDYIPGERCVETKSLKMFFWSFREEGHFCEQLAPTIRDALVEALAPERLYVIVKFKSRGGIVIEAESSHVSNTFHAGDLHP